MHTCSGQMIMLLSPDLSDQEATGSNSHGEATIHAQQQEPKAKKKRSQPGNPDPGAEVIALSPRTLVATNRFVCEICNKGFQRDQNLQLHRRGHNLPWKLRQRGALARADGDGTAAAAARKRVYVCPEPNCVHHDPARALGDLTGIKKHYWRKHGEKRWRCERCGKRYAVHSDWKAHVKNCGTREYRCDCGILFSRKDSLVTHRAFCDALAEESARLLAATNNSSSNNNNNCQLLINNNSSLFLPFSNPPTPNPNPNPNPNPIFFLPQEGPLLPPFQLSPYLLLPTTTTASSITREAAETVSYGLSSEGSVGFHPAGGHRLTRDFLGVDAGEVEELQLPFSATTCQGCPTTATATVAAAACCATDLTRQYFGRFPPANETWSDF